jgi:PAS domain S-box-containing protein
VTLIAAGLFLGTTLGLALLETTGGVLPRYFPDPPLVVWSLLCLYLAVTTLPLSLVLRALNQTLGVASQRATFNQAVRDSLTAHIAVIDATGVIISTNRAWDRFAIENGGSSPQKYGLGANYLDACAQAASGEDLVARQVLAGLQAVQDGVQDCFDIEYPCDSPSEKRWFAMHATRLGGGGRALVVSHQNITDRKRAQEEMGGSQALLRAVLDGTPDLMFLKDRQSRIVLANPATLHVIGKPAEEVLGKTDLEFYDDPEIGRPIMENDRRIMETGRAESMEETVPTPGGTRIFLSTKSPYFDANGRIIGIIGMASDITERKRAEQKILEHMQELERWRKATLGREDRVLELKREINRLLAQLGEPPRYTGGLTEP